MTASPRRRPWPGPGRRAPEQSRPAEAASFVRPREGQHRAAAVSGRVEPAPRLVTGGHVHVLRVASADVRRERAPGAELAAGAQVGLALLGGPRGTRRLAPGASGGPPRAGGRGGRRGGGEKL